MSDRNNTTNWSLEDRSHIQRYFNTVSQWRPGSELIFDELDTDDAGLAVILDRFGEELVSIHRKGDKYALASNLRPFLEGKNLNDLLLWHTSPLEALYQLAS